MLQSSLIFFVPRELQVGCYRGVLVQSQTACEVQIDAPEDAEYFVREIEPDCLALVLDANGNHVIQRCLQKFRAPHTDPIHEVVLSNCLNVARHRHGCCVLQRCIDYTMPERRQALAMAVAEHGLGLSQNAYGNYVVQVLPLHVCPCMFALACLPLHVCPCMFALACLPLHVCPCIGSCPCTSAFPLHVPHMLQECVPTNSDWYSLHCVYGACVIHACSLLARLLPRPLQGT
jgi:hypothetical protein